MSEPFWKSNLPALARRLGLIVECGYSTPSDEAPLQFAIDILRQMARVGPSWPLAVIDGALVRDDVWRENGTLVEMRKTHDIGAEDKPAWVAVVEFPSGVRLIRLSQLSLVVDDASISVTGAGDE